jgi:uncharacterized protein (DUF2336 family)
MSDQPKLQDLIDLAKEPSSEKRRELLREVTDLFFESPQSHNMREEALFDGVMVQLASEMEAEVRAELAHRLADQTRAPSGILRRLAHDDISVAGPILMRSRLLTEEDLISVVSQRGQHHLRAVSQRDGLTERVSDIIVERGDDDTLGVLLRNETAPLSRRSAEVVVDRASVNPALHEAVVQRRSMPADLLNEMYFVVEARLREAILERNTHLDPTALQSALEASRKRMASRDGALPPDYAEAENHIRELKSKGKINPAALVSFLRYGERTRFLVALADITGIDYTTAHRIVDNKQIDALAIVCKAAGFDRTLFLTFTVLVLDNGEGMGKAQVYGKLYTELEPETAKRTLRFWRMRRDMGDVAA